MLRERALHSRWPNPSRSHERFGFVTLRVTACHGVCVRPGERRRPIRCNGLAYRPDGYGEELVGKAIHFNNSRRQGPLVQINCGALPWACWRANYSVTRRARSGSRPQHKGRFEQADGGTLMLDEVGEMPLETQVKLLRVLESGEFQRVGGTRTMSVDVRLVAATNRTLREEVHAGRFREDLFYRLNVFEIALPPLTQRMDDVPHLVEHFVQKFAAQHKRPVTDVSRSAMDTLMRHNWPGNIRELEHAVERAIILAATDTITRFELPEPVRPSDTPDASESVNIAEVLRAKERELVEAALRAEGGVQARAARRLGVSRANLNYRIKNSASSSPTSGARSVDVGGPHQVASSPSAMACSSAVRASRHWPRASSSSWATRFERTSPND